jgi:hypothetical protein
MRRPLVGSCPAQGCAPAYSHRVGRTWLRPSGHLAAARPRPQARRRDQATRAGRRRPTHHRSPASVTVPCASCRRHSHTAVACCNRLRALAWCRLLGAVRRRGEVHCSSRGRASPCRPGQRWVPAEPTDAHGAQAHTAVLTCASTPRRGSCRGSRLQLNVPLCHSQPGAAGAPPRSYEANCLFGELGVTRELPQGSRQVACEA